MRYLITYIASVGTSVIVVLYILAQITYGVRADALSKEYSECKVGMWECFLAIHRDISSDNESLKEENQNE